MTDDVFTGRHPAFVIPTRLSIVSNRVDIRMEVSRREFVGGVSLGICGLAGCTQKSTDDIVISNETTSELTATVRVVRLSDDERVLDESFTLPPVEPEGSEEDKTYSEVAGDEETVRIHLTVQDGPEGTQEFTDSMDTGGMWIDIYSDTIEFQRVAA